MTPCFVAPRRNSLFVPMTYLSFLTPFDTNWNRAVALRHFQHRTYFLGMQFRSPPPLPKPFTFSALRKHLTTNKALDHNSNYNGCSPLKRSESPMDIRCVLMGFATFGQFSSRVYANVAVGQGFWQAEVQRVQQSAAGWIRFRYAQTTAPVLHFHFGRAKHLQLM
jgi:hypothetical protein